MSATCGAPRRYRPGRGRRHRCRDGLRGPIAHGGGTCPAVVASWVQRVVLT